MNKWHRIPGYEGGNVNADKIEDLVEFSANAWVWCGCRQRFAKDC